MLAFACTNEPFILYPLGISLVENVTTATTAQYKYKNQRIVTYTRSGTGITSMKFHYSDQRLERVVIDSTATSYGLMRITGVSRMPERDSLYLVTPLAKTLIQARVFSYNDSQQLTQIDVFTPGPTGTTKVVYKLSWSGNNISTLAKETTPPAGTTSATTLSIGHDARKGVYSSDVAYFYTLSLDELYWLSANNPIRFKRDTLKEVTYRYFYNTKGYPTHILTDKRQTIGHTYVELR